jgi:hypothetical protein
MNVSRETFREEMVKGGALFGAAEGDGWLTAELLSVVIAAIE